jgi:hypothetical protein
VRVQFGYANLSSYWVDSFNLTLSRSNETVEASLEVTWPVDVLETQFELEVSGLAERQSYVVR